MLPKQAQIRLFKKNIRCCGVPKWGEMIDGRFVD